MPAAANRPGHPTSRVWRITVWALAALAVVAVLTVVAPGRARAEAAVGSTETFWARDWGTSAYSQIQATARYVGEHCVVYVQDAALFHPSLVTQLASAFDLSVYPAVTEAYGSEPDPGIDGDHRIAILIYDFHDDTIDGSFRERDMNPGNSAISNRREMFYLNLQALISEPQNMGALAAHELAHLILYYRDVMLDGSSEPSAESTWLSEGFTTYAEHLAGYDDRVNGQLHAFTADPGLGLTRFYGWRANYGASYAFVRYMTEREGSEFIRALLEQPLDGVAGINATLRSLGAFGETFDTLYDDWILANLLDGRAPQCPPYVYGDLDVSAATEVVSGASPLLGTGEVPDFGAVYLDFPPADREKIFQAVIDGTDKAPLQAALISWDSDGLLPPTVTRLDLANAATGGTVNGLAGFDRHTLAVWARGTVGSDDSFTFRYSCAPDPPAGVQFLDMGGSDPFYTYVAPLLTLGVVSGREVPAGSGLWFFMGKENVLRKQFAKMIMEAIGLHTPIVERLSDPSFSDVRPIYDDGWPLEYPYDYIEEAAALSIVTGYQGGMFRPDNPITRSQLVLMITRGAAAAGQPLPPYTGSEKRFVDVPLSHPRYEEIMTAYSAGILSGSEALDGRWYFYPDSPASRSHVAKMTANLCEHLGR